MNCRWLLLNVSKKRRAQPKRAFMVGGASVYPKEFTLQMGMGAGGITALVVKVENQKTAYIVIDGNNMIPDLREKILADFIICRF